MTCPVSLKDNLLLPSESFNMREGGKVWKTEEKSWATESGIGKKSEKIKFRQGKITNFSENEFNEVVLRFSQQWIFIRYISPLLLLILSDKMVKISPRKKCQP